MAVAFDSFFASAESLDANDITVACTPVGTPKGVIVYALANGVGTDVVTSVTYGGTAMTEVALSPLLKTTGETMGAYGYFLGASVPTGVQNCVVDRSGATGMVVGVILLTAGGDVEVIDTDSVQSDSVALGDPTTTLALGGRTCFAAVGFGSGVSAVSAITPLSGWTDRVEIDHGSGCSGLYTYDTIGATDVTAGWTQTVLEDANGLSIAVSEVSAGTTVTPTTLALALTTYAPTIGGSSTMLAADRTAVVANHGVQFSVNVAITAGTAIPIHTGAELVDHVLYVWDFGDANDFDAGNNLRIGFGANVSHIYKIAGTYTATLYAIEDGVTSTFTQVITVSAFSGSHRYIDAATGDDADDGTTTGLAWATMTRAHADFLALASGTERRYNVTAVTAAGVRQTYQHNAATSIGTRTALAEFIAYDPGATGIKPEIVCTNNAGFTAMDSTTDDVLFKGLNIRSTSLTTSNIAFRPGKHTAILDCIIDAFDSGVSTSPLHGLKEYFIMQQCRLINTRRYGMFFNFGRYNASIANVIDGVSVTNGEHLHRLYWDKGYVAYNEFIGGSQNNKNQLKWVGIAAIGNPNRPSQVPSDIANSTYCTVWRNRGHSAPTGVQWSFAFSPTDQTQSELSTQLMVWENKISLAGNGRVCYYVNWGSNSYCNNVSDLTGSSNTTRIGLQVVQRGVEAAPDNNHVYHHTTYCGAGSGTIRGIQVSAASAPATLTPDGTNIRNCLLNAIAGSGTVDGTDGVSDGGTNTTKTPNLATTSATALVAPGGIDGDYRPTDGGAAVNGVTRLADCYLPANWDLSMTPRPSGASASDYGAFEFVSTVVVPVEPEPLIPSTGVNLDKCKYNGTALIFKDIMKQSGVDNGTYAAYGWQTINSSTLADTADTVTDYIGATGWPDVTLPASTRTIEAYMQSYATGSHTVLFDGAGTLIFRGAAIGTVTASGQTVTVDTANSTIRMRVSATDVGNPINNIRVVPAEWVSTYVAAPFYPPLITRLQSFATQGLRTVIRAMELTRTNGDKPVTGVCSGVTTTVTATEGVFHSGMVGSSIVISTIGTFVVAGYTSPTVITITGDATCTSKTFTIVAPWNFSQRSGTNWNSQATGFGMAWETVFDLANEVGADLWINIPHQYADAAITSLAALALTDLDTNLRLFIEFSNEVWNDSFDQGVFADAAGNTAGFTGTADEKGQKWYVKRCAEMFDLFKAAWGESSSRIVKVIGSQASATTATDSLMDYFEETSIDGISVNPNGTKVNLLAVAPYFGRHITTADYFGEDIGPTTGDSSYLTMSVPTAIERIRTDYLPLSISFLQAQKTALAIWSAVQAKPYTGVQLGCYETGSSITSDVAGDQASAGLTAFLIAVQSDANFYDLTLQYLTQLEAIGGTVICWFHFCDEWTGPDMFGAMRTLGTDVSLSPKWRAIRDFNAGIRWVGVPGGGGTPGGALPGIPRFKPFNRRFSRAFRSFGKGVDPASVPSE